jgi:tetratricopeptide (TPR) repeat protein
MGISINPYIAGNPVGGSDVFIGRADILREVVRVLRRPQDNAIVLYGQRRIGKTSILQHLEMQLIDKGPYRPVYFDLQDKAAWPLERVLQQLAREIAQILELPEPDLDNNVVFSFREKWLPAALDTLPSKHSLILLFDEFDVLADPKAKQASETFFPYLRGLLAQDRERVQFVFVIGRNIDDLDTIALSLFKGTPSIRVSLLSKTDTIALVRISELDNTLKWSDEAVERVYELTNGHPFLTQKVCSHVWERAHDTAEDPTPVAPSDVEDAIPDALEASRNTLEWLWDGLPPAERVVISALAEAGPTAITQEDLEHVLHESGVRVVIRELQNAPNLLQEWDLIEPLTGDKGYRFRVELLRRWLVNHKPLKRVQEELDKIEPVAENLYEVGRAYYQNSQLDQAVERLREAIGLNPNHVKANQLLADILLAQERIVQARDLLERLYEYQPAAARTRLVRALIAQAQKTEHDNEKLTLYEQVLELNPRNSEAIARLKRIWRRRGDAALKANDYESALEAYLEAGLDDEASRVQKKIRQRELNPILENLEALKHEQNYQAALDLARRIKKTYPGIQDQLLNLEHLEQRARMADLYQQGLGALHSGDRATAISLLTEVVAMDPEYKEVTRFLHQAVTGTDVTAAEIQLSKAANQKTEELSIGSDRIGCNQQEARRIDENQDTEETIGEPLSPWNPLNYLRLLWWTLVSPSKLRALKVPSDKIHEMQISKWLVSTLTWLPLTAFTVALGFEKLLHSTAGLSPLYYLAINLVLICTWLLTSQLRNELVTGSISFMVSLSTTTILTIDIVKNLKGSNMLLMAGGIPLIVALIIAVSVAISLGNKASHAAAYSVTGILTSVLTVVVMVNTVGNSVGNLIGDLAGVVAGGLAGLLAGGLICIVVVLIAGLLADVAENSIETGRSSWVTRGAFGALVMVYAFVIWLVFLSGWQVFH